MEEKLWSVFCDTGDPLCYLLWKASDRLRGAQSGASTQTAEPPP